jgi:hypothetical protein
MPKRYEVLERSFINGRLYEKGETVLLEIDSPGGNLKLSSGKASAQSAQAAADGYSAARSGAGKFVVKDAAGQMVGTFTGTKEEAEKEAERLNQGGAIAVAQDAQGDLPDA